LAPGASQAEREIATLIERGMGLVASARPQSVREWRARIARTPTAAADQAVPEPEFTAAGGRERWPKILLAAVLIAAAAIAVFLFVNRTDDTDRSSEAADGGAQVSDWTSPEEVERWRQALEANAVITYRDFIEDYPQSVHVPQALEQIGVLEDKAWEAIVAEGTRAAYEAHLEVFPKGRHAAAALARIEEFRQEEARLARENAERARQDDAAWRAARSAGTLAALDGYISAWPGGSHLAEAHDLRQKLQGGHDCQ